MMKIDRAQTFVKFGGGVGLMLLAILVCGCGRKPTPADTIFNQTGTYLSPNGLLSIEIKTGANAQMRYRFSFTNGETLEYNNFPAGKDWFMCWDRNNNLWMYVADTLACSWYSPGPKTMIQHKMAPIVSSDIAQMPKVYIDKLPEDLKPKPVTRTRRTQ